MLSAVFKPIEPLVAKSGSTTVVRMPELTATWFGTDREYDVAYEVTFARTDPAAQNGLKPEAVSPDYRGPGLRWTRRQVANTPGIPEAAPYGTFTDVAAEKAANRSLFWAGLLGGAALSVLAWAGDLVLVGAAERWRESERRARRGRGRAAGDRRVGGGTGAGGAGGAPPCHAWPGRRRHPAASGGPGGGVARLVTPAGQAGTILGGPRPLERSPDP